MSAESPEPRNSCAWHRSALAIALRHLGADGPRLVRRLVGAERWSSWVERQALPDSAPALPGLLAEIERPVPAGATNIHPSWLAEAGYRAARPPPTEPVDQWLAFGGLAQLVAMPTGPMPSRSAVVIRDLPLAPAERLREALRAFGAWSLAWAAHGDDAGPMAVAHRLTEPAAHRFRAIDEALDRALSMHGATDTSRWLGPRQAARERIRGIEFGDRHALERIAARALAPLVQRAGGDLARQLAQRLPMALGLAVLAEMSSRFRLADPGTAPPLGRFLELLERPWPLRR